MHPEKFFLHRRLSSSRNNRDFRIQLNTMNRNAENKIISTTRKKKRPPTDKKSQL
jgi:hypothetical protein